MQPDDASKYSDIIILPHHVSSTRRRMTNAERAAQFSPFAALTGFDLDIIEAARITTNRIDIDDEVKQNIADILSKTESPAEYNKNFEITYFLPDNKKDGGEYVIICGKIKKVNTVERNVILEGKVKIPIDEIVKIRETE